MLKKIWKMIISTLLVLCVITMLLFLKAWMNNREKRGSEIASLSPHTNATSGSKIDISEKLVLYDGDEEKANSLSNVKISVEDSNVHAPLTMDKSKKSGTNDDLLKQSDEDICHQIMVDYCIKELEPRGLTLTLDNYFYQGQYCVLLYFSGGSGIPYENKKQAAINLSQYVFTGFENQTGFETDYLKVHFKLPEGESFALERNDFKTWVSSGGSGDELFNMMSNCITSGSHFQKSVISNVYEKPPVCFEELKPTEIVIEYIDENDAPVDPSSVKLETKSLKKQLLEVTAEFNAINLQAYLLDVLGEEYGFTVEGCGTEDVGIYIFINQSKDELSYDELESLCLNLCDVIFRNHSDENLLKVRAFKLIDTNKETLYVFERDDVSQLWPEGESDKAVKEYIHQWR